MISKVKVAMSHGASDRCWPISRERKVPEIPKLVGRLPTLQAILHTCFRVKRSKIKVSRETESVSYLRSGKAYRLQNWYADRACYQLPRPAVKAYEVWFLHAGGGIPCQPNPAATQLVLYSDHIRLSWSILFWYECSKCLMCIENPFGLTNAGHVNRTVRHYCQHHLHLITKWQVM